MNLVADRSLHVDPSDGRPETALGWGFIGLLELVGGVVVVVALPLAVMAFVAVMGLISWMLTDTLAELAGQTEEDLAAVLEEEDIIEARFVQLGRDFREELPNREVPLLDTAPRQPSEVPTLDTPTEQAEPTERVETPPDAVEDEVLRDVLNRSQIFAEIAEEREREGSPDGIEEGTETEGTEGDIYRGRISSMFRREWRLPVTMSREAASSLTAVARIRIGPNLEIVSFEIQRSSGDPLFDQSVIDQITRLQATDQRIPPPPEDVAAQYIDTTIAVRFSGRQASR